mmetsp:Transcript_2641/g.7879  ORF Transcript_2641/g.7879 Transcript_2641/m.7879 type:complete len:238 (-) Transcript_2641:827-1540(-)
MLTSSTRPSSGLAVATNARAASIAASRRVISGGRSRVTRLPSCTRSIASPQSRSVASERPSRVAASTDMFSRLAMSAPENPGVLAARLQFGDARSVITSLASGLPRACTSRICLRPSKLGRPMNTLRSKRPARISALSRMSGRLVAAMMTTRLDFCAGSLASVIAPSKPSSSVSSWLTVASRSSLPDPPPVPRCLPTASSSSMKMMLGAHAFACWKRSRTRAAPTPTNISTNSDALA